MQRLGLLHRAWDLSRAGLEPPHHDTGWWTHCEQMALSPRLAETPRPNSASQELETLVTSGDSTNGMDFGVWLLRYSPSFCDILQASVSSGYKRSLREAGWRSCPVEPHPTDRFTDTGGVPFWGLPERAEGHFEGPESLILLGILSGHTYICTSFKVWENNGFLGEMGS